MRKKTFMIINLFFLASQSSSGSTSNHHNVLSRPWGMITALAGKNFDYVTLYFF